MFKRAIILFFFCSIFELISLTKIDYNGFLKCNVETFKFEKVPITDIFPDKNKYIILLSEYNCFNCISELKNEITKKCKNNSDEYIIILRSKLSVKFRKSFYSMIANIFDKNRIFFDIHTEEDEWPPIKTISGIFSNFPIKQTPCLIYLDYSRKSIKFQPYSELFP